MKLNNIELEAVKYLRTPTAIRQKCDRLFNLASENKLNFFCVDLSELDKAANYVIDTTRQQYPDFNIPFHSQWRHFEAGNQPRLAQFDAALTEFSVIEQAKIKFDLAIVSVLLDASTGADWQYCEAETKEVYRRSEGLAVATFRMFCQGIFSSNPDFPWQADFRGLSQLKLETLAAGFQVSRDNPLVGLTGRLELLQRLGNAICQHPLLFGSENQRPGNLAQYLLDSLVSGVKTVDCAKILSAVLTGFGENWPGKYAIGGVNLGEVWRHRALQGENLGDEFVPFHQLSQWLTYSLLEPLQELGLYVVRLDELTGLAGYRNGGLCLDMGLLRAKDSAIFEQKYLPGSEVVVEWRSVTVILLDKIAAAMRYKLDLSATKLPLVKILQGGTWAAGRKIATELRAAGVPPIHIESDGTFFNS
ncbi:MAG: URC4/urg3 family protein [Microcoleus sp. PH2017_29_MFU_D_A]|uniref:URC4/urg3 family protein n=1 Tax=unclassified Microcoleus TaxID=2642155 RepID=UPI001D7B5AFA|nr:MULTISPECIES: URC4/urg3 family protein [unclassified Microcoleus]MCC3444863.1 URC4/urg3 family protein [Microcoleus sp. PH2017_03_ELD_O_A]MCC3454855.1 URC4/urg3 family protein [Microcoleus sp. PH2017_08_TRC_O_A]MCC3490786.1 URC4/urg3 family protein [Microcoleus sp. PH2017_16_JOR_D_A]MCC3602239.1 URC4/urg3 family protein [Microcoleus sp. PH2017_29_MFU_D_A]MCC3635853.1 URC4/urg3 family protein [Microcoleus sp. PH2017_37_MFU_D_B]